MAIPQKSRGLPRRRPCTTAFRCKKTGRTSRERGPRPPCCSPPSFSLPLPHCQGCANCRPGRPGPGVFLIPSRTRRWRRHFASRGLSLHPFARPSTSFLAAGRTDEAQTGSVGSTLHQECVHCIGRKGVPRKNGGRALDFGVYGARYPTRTCRGGRGTWPGQVESLRQSPAGRRATDRWTDGDRGGGDHDHAEDERVVGRGDPEEAETEATAERQWYGGRRGWGRFRIEAGRSGCRTASCASCPCSTPPGSCAGSESGPTMNEGVRGGTRLRRTRCRRPLACGALVACRSHGRCRAGTAPVGAKSVSSMA